MIRNREHTMKSLSALTSQARRKGKYPLLHHVAKYKIFVLLSCTVFSSCWFAGQVRTLAKHCFFICLCYCSTFWSRSLKRNYNKIKKISLSQIKNKSSLKIQILKMSHLHLPLCMSTAQHRWINNDSFVLHDAVD